MEAHEGREDEQGELDCIVQRQTEEEGDDDAQRGRVAFVATCYAGGRCGKSALLRGISIIGAGQKSVVSECGVKVEVH